jgi:transposase
VAKSPRSGRPKKLSPTEVRYIVRMIKKDRSVSWNALVDKAGGHVSYKTIKRAVRAIFSRKWKSLKRPKIAKEAAARRLRFALDWLPKVEELIKVWPVEVGDEF